MFDELAGVGALVEGGEVRLLRGSGCAWLIHCFCISVSA